VGIDGIDREAHDLHISLLEIFVALGEFDELGGADGSEVGRVREQDHPLVFQIGEGKRAVSGVRRGELGRGIVDSRHGALGDFGAHKLPP
jgi:hypothetical protein